MRDQHSYSRLFHDDSIQLHFVCIVLLTIDFDIAQFSNNRGSKIRSEEETFSRNRCTRKPVISWVVLIVD